MAKTTPTTQTTTTQLSPEQRQLLDLAMPGVQKFAASVPQRYGGETVAGFTAPQVAGQEMALGAAGTQGNLARKAVGTENFYNSGDIWNPATNPNLQGAINAAVRPISQQLTETTLPAVRGEAVSSGNFGSSRQGIAEGLASRGASQATGDTASRIAQNQYETNVRAQLQSLGLLPTVQGAQTVPATTTSGVGDVQQALAQAQRNAQITGFNYDQLAPFLQSKELISLLGATPGGGTTATASVAQPNPAMQAIGAGAALLPFLV